MKGHTQRNHTTVQDINKADAMAEDRRIRENERRKNHLARIRKLTPIQRMARKVEAANKKAKVESKKEATIRRKMEAELGNNMELYYLATSGRRA